MNSGFEDKPGVIDSESEVKKLQDLVKKLETQNQLLRSKQSEREKESVEKTNHGIVDLSSVKTVNNGRIVKTNHYLKPQTLAEDVNNVSLEDVKPIDVESRSEVELQDDEWLFQSPKRASPAQQQQNAYQWMREEFEHPSPELEGVRRSLIHKLEEVARVPRSSSSGSVGSISSHRSLPTPTVSTPTICPPPRHMSPTPHDTSPITKPVYRDSSPAPKHSSPAYNENNQTAKYSSPAHYGSSPAPRHSNPAHHGSSPAPRHSSPAYHGSSPALRHSSPAHHGSSPALRHSSPASRDNSPTPKNSQSPASPLLHKHTLRQPTSNSRFDSNTFTRQKKKFSSEREKENVSSDSEDVSRNRGSSLRPPGPSLRVTSPQNHTDEATTDVLKDVVDVQVVARMQEESLRQSQNSPYLAKKAMHRRGNTKEDSPDGGFSTATFTRRKTPQSTKLVYRTAEQEGVQMSNTSLDSVGSSNSSGAASSTYDSNPRLDHPHLENHRRSLPNLTRAVLSVAPPASQEAPCTSHRLSPAPGTDRKSPAAHRPGSPHRCGIPTPRSSIPRPGSKLPTPRKSAIPSARRNVTTPRLVDDSWKDGCF